MTRRKTLGHYGPRRGGVRVLEDGDYARVQWYEDGQRRVKSFARTKEGKAEALAWAQGFAETRFGTTPAPERLTLRGLWDRYKLAEFPTLRPRTRELYAEHWQRWELFCGKQFIAENARQETVDRFRARLTSLGLAVGHQQRIVRDVKTVYAWADTRELLARNRLAGYRFKIAKEARAERPAEYRRMDVEQILAQLSPQKSEEWRPWAALTIAAFQGARERSILHLSWADVDLIRGRITWRSKYDKTGREWSQPLTIAAYSALLTARYWRDRDGEKRPWVFYSPWARKKSGREEQGVYGAQALWLALKKAELRAGVPRLPFRAVHGFRRGVAGDVARNSGNPWLAIQYIGDRDPDRIAEYVQERTDSLDGAADMLDKEWTQRGPAHIGKSDAARWLRSVVGDDPWFEKQCAGISLGRHLYCVYDAANEAVKLGVSDKPELRLDALQIGSATPLVLAGAIPEAEAPEAVVHWVFRADHLQGEWFRLSRDLVRWLALWPCPVIPAPPKTSSKRHEGRAAGKAAAKSRGTTVLQAPEAGLEPATRRDIEEAQKNQPEHESASAHLSTEHVQTGGKGQKK